MRLFDFCLVAYLVANILELPVDARNGLLYFHSRYENYQIKRSLNTRNPTIAMIRALELLKVIDTIDSQENQKIRNTPLQGYF